MCIRKLAKKLSKTKLGEEILGIRYCNNNGFSVHLKKDAFLNNFVVYETEEWESQSCYEFFTYIEDVKIFCLSETL